MSQQPTNDPEDRLRRMDTAALGRFAETIWAQVFRLAGSPCIWLDAALALASVGRDPGAALTLRPPSRPDQPPGLYAAVHGKRHTVFWRQGREYRHGIPLANWERYDRLDADSRRWAHVCIWESFTDEEAKCWSGSLLCQSLTRLGKPYRGFGPLTDTALWPRDRFALLGQVLPGQVARLYRGEEMPEAVKASLFGLLEAGDPDPAQARLF